jgi:CBS domain-containing protein
MKKLREIMRPGFVFAVPRHATVAEATRLMDAENVGIVSVVDGDRLIGVFSERDVTRRVVATGLDPGNVRVGDVMTSDLIVADADEDYQSAMLKMDQANIRHLPVVSDGRLLSMLSIRDLMRVHIDRQGEELRYLHEYLYQVPSA